MTTKKSTTDGRATRIPPEPELEQLIALLDAEAETKEQRAIIYTTLRELSDETGVRLPKPGADLHDFYREAAYCIGAAGPRHRMREALKMIAEGERFDDYKKGDALYLWKTKRARRLHSNTRDTAAELARRLSDPETPADYCGALKSALRDHCKAVGSKYNAKDLAWTYTEAQGESERFHVITDRPGWETVFDTRSNLLDLLRGLRKRLPLAAIRLRRVRGWGDEQDGEEAPAADVLGELRRRLEHLGEDITDSTARFRLEKEIFDLEHPKDADWNDWSAWEEGGEG